MIRSLPLLALCGVHAAAYTTHVATVQYAGKDGEASTIDVARAGTAEAQKLADGHAKVTFTNSLFQTGWDRVDVQTKGTDRASAFSAGFGEGYLSQRSIWDMYRNNYADWFVDQGDAGFPPEKAFDWLRGNYNWTRTTADAKAAAGEADAFWTWTAVLLNQLEGLAKGYNRAAPADEQLGFEAFLLLNADGDLESLQNALGPKATQGDGPREMRCSAMYRMSDDGSDIFFGHTTWDHFDEAYRSLKVYAWGSDVTVKMSSSPGFLSSVDDFYISSKGLSIIETTNGNFNADLWAKVHQASVLSWVRSMVANYAAGSAAEWTSLFATENSGTYNNQWMVLDMNKFVPGRPLVAETFMILEQLPGLCVVEDMSAHLQKHRYWGSYNVPAIPKVWQLSGFGGMQPAWKHSHSGCPRALMMQELNATVNTIEGAKKALRYNRFNRNHTDHDVWAGYGISGRFDLIPEFASGYALSGGIDSKVSSYALAFQQNASFWAQNGPSHDGVPAFDWGQVAYPNPVYATAPAHVGLPSLMDWDWVHAQ